MDLTSFHYYRVIECYRYPASGYHHLPECVHVVLTETLDYTLAHPSPQTYVYRLCASAGGNMGTAIPGWLPFFAYERRVHEVYEETSHEQARRLAPRLIAYTDTLLQDRALLHESVDMLQTFLAYRDACVQQINAHPPQTDAEFEQLCQEPLKKMQAHPQSRATEIWLSYYDPAR